MNKNDPLLVETDGGALAGVRVNGVRTWRGVPYGVAERWKRPRLVEWEGQWPAEDYGPVAPQTTYTWKDEVVGNEDCLNLDVVRPDTDEQLPVVVYLHGGGFFAGASHTAVLRGFNFSKELNVVYVAVNFRLGVLGYLDMSSLGAEDSSTCEPNPAVHDHLAALRWVQRNIEQFGGDPRNVTIMGESAGGSAAAVLMAVPQAADLFSSGDCAVRAGDDSPLAGTIHRLGSQVGAVCRIGTTNLHHCRAACSPCFRFSKSRSADAVARRWVARIKPLFWHSG